MSFSYSASGLLDKLFFSITSRLCVFDVSLWCYFVSFFGSHGHTTYLRRRNSSVSWWRPMSSQTWPMASEFTPTQSFLFPFPKNYTAGCWEMARNGGRGRTLKESRWPAHCRGFYIRGNYYKTYIQERFCGEMHTHVPCEPKAPADWSRRTVGEQWICLVPVLLKDSRR